MTVKFPKTFGAECRGCDHYIKQRMDNLKPGSYNQGIHLACAECETTNFCTPEENE